MSHIGHQYLRNHQSWFNRTKIADLHPSYKDTIGIGLMIVCLTFIFGLFLYFLTMWICDNYFNINTDSWFWSGPTNSNQIEPMVMEMNVINVVNFDKPPPTYQSLFIEKIEEPPPTYKDAIRFQK